MGAPSGSIDCYPARRGPLPDGPGVVYGWAVTSYFGGRIDPITGKVGRHGGEDQAYYRCEGSPIIAPIGGLLSQGWDSSGGGNWSGLTGHNGDCWGFGHAERFAWPGGGTRWVEAGTVIAYTGTTGGSTGPHNHIAYRPRGATGYRDPHDILVAAASAGADITDQEEELTMADIEALKQHITNEAEMTRVYLHQDLVASREWIVSTINAENDADREAADRVAAEREEVTRRWLADRVKGVPE